MSGTEEHVPQEPMENVRLSSGLSPTRRIRLGTRLRSPPSPVMPPLEGGARLRWRLVNVDHPSGVIRITRLKPSLRLNDFDVFVTRVAPELIAILRGEVARGPVKAKVTLDVVLTRGHGGETKRFSSGAFSAAANTLLPLTRASEVAPQVAAMLAVVRQRFEAFAEGGSGWRFVNGAGAEVRVVNYVPLSRGRSRAAHPPSHSRGTPGARQRSGSGSRFR